MSFIQHMGATIRHIAAEARPPARDTFNDLGEGIGPGMKSVAKAVAEPWKCGKADSHIQERIYD